MRRGDRVGGPRHYSQHVKTKALKVCGIYKRIYNPHKCIARNGTFETKHGYVVSINSLHVVHGSPFLFKNKLQNIDGIMNQ